MDKRALITGITGQDGSYLAELLLNRGYEVHGVVRHVALEDPAHRLSRIRNILHKVVLHTASLASYRSMLRIVAEVRPDECYHLAAQSFVSFALEDDFSTIDTNINGTLLTLCAIKESAPKCKFYFAGSSEMFGNVHVWPQDESTSFNPRSLYGISKVAGVHLVRTYRDLHGIHACVGILFNHESPRRGFEFVTRKISHAVARIKCGQLTRLPLGYLDARRDWGFAGDYVEAMWLMLQHDTPDDYVIATGTLRTVKEFAELAFARVGLNWQDHVVVDPKFFRPRERNPLVGDFSRAEKILSWRPKVGFEQLVEMMVLADLELVRSGELGGHCNDLP